MSFKLYHMWNCCHTDHISTWFNIYFVIHIVRTQKQWSHCNRHCRMRPHFCDTRAVVIVEQRQKLHCNDLSRPHWVSGTLNINKNKNLLEIGVLDCWGGVVVMYPSRMRPNPYLILLVTRSHVGKSLLKLFITDLYAYWIFVEYLRYNVLIFCLCV